MATSAGIDISIRQPVPALNFTRLSPSGLAAMAIDWASTATLIDLITIQATAHVIIKKHRLLRLP